MAADCWQLAALRASASRAGTGVPQGAARVQVCTLCILDLWNILEGYLLFIHLRLKDFSKE